MVARSKKPSASPIHEAENYHVLHCLFRDEDNQFGSRGIGRPQLLICHANFLFVGSRLLRDPINEIPHHFIERIIGNVGKPSLPFLVTPPDPMVQDYNPSLWHLIAHDKLDGLAQGSFQGTSFHLSFTGYNISLHVDQRSVRDVPARSLETAISVYDRQMDCRFGHPRSIQVLDESTETTGILFSHGWRQKGVAGLDLVSVDTWLELLDPPEEGQDSVVRARDHPIGAKASQCHHPTEQDMLAVSRAKSRRESALLGIGSDVRKLRN